MMLEAPVLQLQKVATRRFVLRIDHLPHSTTSLVETKGSSLQIHGQTTVEKLLYLWDETVKQELRGGQAMDLSVSRFQTNLLAVENEVEHPLHLVR